jgi:hypothetical protein
MAVKAQGITTKSTYEKMKPKEGSSTQKRKANKAKHMQTTKGM